MDEWIYMTQGQMEHAFTEIISSGPSTRLEIYVCVRANSPLTIGFFRRLEKDVIISLVPSLDESVATSGIDFSRPLMLRIRIFQFDKFNALQNVFRSYFNNFVSIEFRN